MRSQYIRAKLINQNISLHNYFIKMWRQISGEELGDLEGIIFWKWDSEQVCKPMENGSREQPTCWDREFGMGKLITPTIWSWIMIAIECGSTPNGKFLSTWKQYLLHSYVHQLAQLSTYNGCSLSTHQANQKKKEKKKPCSQAIVEKASKYNIIVH